MQLFSCAACCTGTVYKEGASVMNELFTNEKILSWLQYYAKNTPVDLERVKMLDITKKNKNVIPTVESHKVTLVFTQAGDPDIFYRMWNAGLGDCDVWYNEGSEPTGEIKNDKLKDMINRGINASAGMLIFNRNARNTYKIGMDNENFRRGSVRYVGSNAFSFHIAFAQVVLCLAIALLGRLHIPLESQ